MQQTRNVLDSTREKDAFTSECMRWRENGMQMTSGESKAYLQGKKRSARLSFIDIHTLKFQCVYQNDMRRGTYIFIVQKQNIPIA